jgi:hypothetical protein
MHAEMEEVVLSYAMIEHVAPGDIKFPYYPSKFKAFALYLEFLLLFFLKKKKNHITFRNKIR